MVRKLLILALLIFALLIPWLIRQEPYYMGVCIIILMNIIMAVTLLPL